jgi:hypothetical protein
MPARNLRLADPGGTGKLTLNPLEPHPTHGTLEADLQ